MPAMNQRGPMGDGPMTGRRMGRCTNFGANQKKEMAEKEVKPTENQNENQNDDAFNFGRGRGFGFRRCRGGGGRGMGWQNRFRGGA